MRFCRFLPPIRRFDRRKAGRLPPRRLRTRLRPGGFSRPPFGMHFSPRSGQGRSESA
ncbi:hypothetical protein GCWU000341_02060 [Oribacterium sp. oral taxon 078 str. F0262]|nr:hypothetical protein GCWU000341_02060 [Oribacterium sp. oral taxon 078 str. F0262]